MPGFAFPADTQAFLADLREHNDRAWFEANRDRYQSAYVAAGKAFVEAVSPLLRAIVPGIRAEPRVLGSIFRINRDTRFSADKRPYKDHLDLWFWEGDRKGAVSGLFVRVSPDLVGIGAGAHGFDKPTLARYREKVADPDAGPELLDIVKTLDAAGYDLGGETYARTPRGFDVSPDTARLLRHSALFVHHDEPPALATDAGNLVGVLGKHWTTIVPLHRWLVTHLQGN